MESYSLKLHRFSFTIKQPTVRTCDISMRELFPQVLAKDKKVRMYSADYSRRNIGIVWPRSTVATNA